MVIDAFCKASIPIVHSALANQTKRRTLCTNKADSKTLYHHVNEYRIPFSESLDGFLFGVIDVPISFVFDISPESRGIFV